MNKSFSARIAMVAPPFGQTGGPEVVVQNLTTALIKKGVKVTLFAPADWKTNAFFVPTLEKSLWNMKRFSQLTKRERKNLVIASQITVLRHQHEFDIVHLHSPSCAYPIGENLEVPVVLTTHNSLSQSYFNLMKAAKIHLVAISKSNKGNSKTSTVIYNGVPTQKIPYSLKPGGYLITIGRLAPVKGIHESIKIARQAKATLLILGRVGISPERIAYYKKVIKPHLDNRTVIHIPEVKHEKVFSYLKQAAALLFTPSWEEPFGMAAIEALATGTPVIGYPSGALPEIIRRKNIGCLSIKNKDLVHAVKKIGNFDRKACRKYAEKYFDSHIMADKYIRLYKKILADR